MKRKKNLSNHYQSIKKCSLSSKIFIEKIHSKETTIKIIPCKCHSYFCEKCSKIKRMNLLSRLKKCFNENDYRFLTLTLDQNKYTPIEAINNISHFFELLRKRLKYENYNFNYFKIVELQKNNIAHLHIILNMYIPNDLIKKHWLDITGSPIIKINKIDSIGKLSVYLLKYLSKNIASYHTELFYFTNKRRYSYSKYLGMPKLDKKNYIDTNIFFNAETNFTDKIKLFLLETYGFIFNGIFTFNTS